MTRPTRAEAVNQAAAAFAQVLRDMRRNGTLTRVQTPAPETRPTAPAERAA